MQERREFNFGKPGLKTEFAFFEKLKEMFPESFDDIMKALDLYYQCVFGADELFKFVEPSFED